MSKRISPVILVAALVASALVTRPATALDTNSPVREGPQAVAAGELGVGRLIPDLEFSPIAGDSSRLSKLKSAKAVVIAFTSTSCPVARRYAPTLAALEKEYAPRGVKFIFINPIASDAENDITQAISAQHLDGPYVRDTQNRIAAAVGARSTAEVFVLDASRTLVYRGAVDDQYGLAYSLAAPRQHYLADALQAILDGKTPSLQATTAPGCALETADGKSIASAPLTFHARISRILQQNCVECHHSGGVAPFSLQTYADVTGHAGMIRKQVEKGVMPPWFAAPMGISPSPWSNDRTLPAHDKADLLTWLNGSRAEGDVADAPLPRTFPKDWTIGQPDVVIQIPEPIEVQATGKMPYQNIYVETKFGEDRWVRAMEVRPTAREVVHHALIHVIPADSVERVRKTNRDADRGNFFAVYVPGNNALQYPEGFAKLIPAGATLHFQIHYTPNGTATHDQTALGLIFSKTPPQHEVRVSAIAAKLDIPPGDSNFEVHGQLPVMFDAKLMAFMPHMHLRGKSYRYELELPNGEKRLLLDVPRYDFNWQLQYRLANYLDAPAGSKLLGTAFYDNSTNNPANPDPARRVKWGEQTDDEMMLGYLEYYVPSVDPTKCGQTLRDLVWRDGGLTFNALDKNHDGVITIDEAPSPQQFREADANGDGVVTREEFKAYWQKHRNPANADHAQTTQ